MKSVTIKIPEGDAIGIDSFNNVVVQLASDNAPMTNIAILNPINGNGNELTLTSSADAEIEDFFKQEKFIVLVDWDFKEDSMRPEMHSNVKIDLVFKLKQ